MPLALECLRRGIAIGGNQELAKCKFATIIYELCRCDLDYSFFPSSLHISLSLGWALVGNDRRSLQQRKNSQIPKRSSDKHSCMHDLVSTTFFSPTWYAPVQRTRWRVGNTMG